MRTYKEQFEPHIVKQIDELVNTVETLRYPTGSSRYYGVDLTMCLKAGALAGSLVLATALMEIYIRGLIVKYTEKAQSGWARKVSVEIELEEKRRESFSSLLNHLVKAELFNEDDASIANKLYKEVRIPTHHGLPSRLLGRNKEDPLYELLKTIGGDTVSLSEFENFFEKEALVLLSEIIGILSRNQIKKQI